MSASHCGKIFLAVCRGFTDSSDLALAEYAALVSRLDPRAVPPPIPRRRSDDILQAVPALGEAPPPPPKERPSDKTAAAEKDDKVASTEEATAKKDEATKPKEEEAPAKEEPAEPTEDDSDDDDELIAIPGPGTPAKEKAQPKLPEPAAASPAQSRSPSPSKIAAAAQRTGTPSDDVSNLADSISNLLIGQRGVHRLFRDFSASLSSKEKEIRDLQRRAEELEGDLTLARTQLSSETAQRVEAQSERDRALRDDASAAKVVERYMTFSQKAHETVHAHLGQLRTRGAATQATLRTEASNLRRRLRSEADRAARLRAAAEEMAEELGKESAGRRREVALRLQLIAADEARSRRAEAWLDRVRRAREPEAKEALTAPTLGALLDEGYEILAPPAAAPEKAAGWGRRLLRRKDAKPEAKASGEDESVARVFLAEELVQHLVDDLQAETERRIELERQRVEWLAKEAEEGVPASEGGGGGLVFDADAGQEGKGDEEVKAAKAETKEDSKKEDEKKEDGKKENEKEDGKEDGEKDDGEVDKKTKKGKKGKADKKGKDDEKDKEDKDAKDSEDKAAKPGSKPDTASTPDTPPTAPHLDDLTALFDPLLAAYAPLQKSLHDQSVSLAALRTSLPDLDAGGKKGPLRALALRPARTARDDLLSLLDGLHEVIEDARVDAEIGVADEDRVFHGFAALLGVGASGVVQATSVLRDAREYAASRMAGPETSDHAASTEASETKPDTSSASQSQTPSQTPLARLTARVADIEHDLALIKRTLHESEGLDAPTLDEDPPSSKERRRKSVWATLPLRTVTPQAARPLPPPPAPVHAHLLAALVEDESDDERPAPKVSLLSSVGRSFSSSVGVAASNVVGAPRRVTDFAGGLYRPRIRKESGGEGVDKDSVKEGKDAKESTEEVKKDNRDDKEGEVE